MHLLLLPLIAFNLHMRNKNMKNKSIEQLANYGLENTIVHCQNLIGELYESQREENSPINQNI
jgi:hypothetical protein